LTLAQTQLATIPGVLNQSLSSVNKRLSLEPYDPIPASEKRKKAKPTDKCERLLLQKRAYLEVLRDHVTAIQEVVEGRRTTSAASLNSS
jgi:hypothetical protein